jgi:hypothetical protein
MKGNLYRFVALGTRTVYRDMVRNIREVNRRYAAPHVKTTRLVKACLLLLRCYLLLLVGILVYKFISILR